MWTYLLGPLVALLPRPWRDALFFTYRAQANRATILSGFIEALGATIALGYWYMYVMTTWIGRVAENALAGKSGAVSEQAIATAALTVWFTHPLTWLLAYIFLEGAVRMVATVASGETLGTLPLFLFDKIVINRFRHTERSGPASENFRSNASSFWDAIRERMMVSRLPQVGDELIFRTSGAEEFLEVSASRRKNDWDPPRVVRFEDSYYRLESSSAGAAPRPFRYTLRRLPAGVPGRSVLLYSPVDALIRQ
jgi:hypothetical protein